MQKKSIELCVPGSEVLTGELNRRTGEVGARTVNLSPGVGFELQALDCCQLLGQ